jgi:conjugal transfer/entry exclusion protein
MLNLKKSNQAEPKKSFSLGTKQQTNKPGMTAEGIAAAAAIRNEMIAIKAEINGQNETVLNSLSVLTDLLKGIDARMQIVEGELKNIKTVSTAMPKDASADKQEAPQAKQSSKQGNALADTFKTHYKGKLAGDKPNEGQYDEVLNLLINSADASSREAFDNSISKVWTQYREEQSVFLYAAKNKQPVLNALWEAFNSQGKARTTQTETSPVFNKAYFADSLQVDEDVIKEILSAVKAAECFADDTEQEIVDYLIDNDCNADDSDIDQFITFCKDTFNG